MIVAGLGCLLLVSCGATTPAPLSAACLGDSADVLAALQRAPQAVRLAGDTPISQCVSRAGDADLQALGVTLTRAADALRARSSSDPVAALRLGYLVGAVRRGAAQTPGIAAQLARRVQQASGPVIESERSRDAQRRGERLGEATG